MAAFSYSSATASGAHLASKVQARNNALSALRILSLSREVRQAPVKRANVTVNAQSKQDC